MDPPRRAAGAVRMLRALLLVAGAGFATATAAAVDPDSLLPVDEAFALRVDAATPGRIALRFAIADGYYLYRHRMGAEPQDAGFRVDAAGFVLPAGKPHTDEFFGAVETYRDTVTGVLHGDAAAPSTTLRVRFQGCADAGICYPPQVRTLRVALPAAAARGAESAADGDAGFAALGRALGRGAGAAAQPPVVGAGATAGQPLPLAPERAFGFDAITADPDTLLLRFTPAPGYYLYRDRTVLRSGSPAIVPGAPLWPRGSAHRDEHFGEVVVYFDQVEVPLPLRREAGAAAATLALTATFQGCQRDGICYPPMTRTVQVALPAMPADATRTTAAAGPASAGTDAGTDADAAAAMPASATPPLPAAAAAAVDPSPGSAANADGAARPASPTTADATADNAARTRAPGALPRGGAATALLLALLGGLVLNLMPCVLPILSLKALAVAQGGGGRQQARRHALWYTAGVLVAFAAVGLLAIALRAGGQALGWGFQLQQPWFVAALVYLMFAVGLSLSGVFTIAGAAGRFGSALATRSGPLGDFFTGVLACVVASPCIAPFMGGALAFAFAAPAWLALAVFLALGLGLALPFLLVGFVPAIAARLPRPGAWMETFRRVLALPMYLTATWLLWVLGRQRGVDAMALVAAGLAVFALALWWREHRRDAGGFPARLLAGALLLASLWPIVQVARMPPVAKAADSGHLAYADAALQALRADGRVVFVNMTADWCVTCKTNERRVLSGAAFADALRAADATYMVGDWTDVDPAIGAFLERHGAVGVPLYVVYPRGGGAGEVLPAVLTDDITAAALARAAAGGDGTGG